MFPITGKQRTPPQMMNIVVRRKGSENNFKSVLETIRGLMDGVASISRVMPTWLQLILLGLGDPCSASYNSSTVRSYARKTVGVANPDAPLDFCDTFLDEQHLRESFRSEIDTSGPEGSGSSAKRQNFKVRFLGEDGRMVGDSSIQAASYDSLPGVKGNPVRFTPPQIEAIRSGLSPGLTLVVGVSNLCHPLFCFSCWWTVSHGPHPSITSLRVQERLMSQSRSSQVSSIPFPRSAQS